MEAFLTHPISALAAGLLLATVLPAVALEAPPKAVVCQSCHGPEGVSASADIPNLAGQKAAYLSLQLQAFRDGTRKNDLMSVIAPQLTPDEIKALAAWWSSLPAGGSGLPAAAIGAATSGAAVSKMTLPTDFPAGYTEYGRENDTASKRISVNYANAVATAAARDGKPLPDGSVVLIVNYAAELDAAGQPVADAGGHWKAGKIASWSGMESRAGWGADIPEMLRNGNWHYGLWSGDGTPRIGAQQPRCLACHKPKADDSYVFTLAALRTAARAAPGTARP